jgi:hypothetical protein
MGYGKREECIQLLKNKKQDWKNVKIIAFDAPQMGDTSYTERLAFLKKGMEIIFNIVLEIHGFFVVPSADGTTKKPWISNTIFPSNFLKQSLQTTLLCV